MNIQVQKRVIALISFILLFYFLLLVGMSYCTISNEGVLQVVQIVGELITIPAILLLIASFVFCFIKLLNKTERKTFMPFFLLNLATIAFLVIMTFVG